MMMWPPPDEGSFANSWRRLPASDDPDVRLTYEVADRLIADDSERDAAGRTDDALDDQRFQAMIAALRAEDPSWTGRFNEPVRRSAVVLWAILAAFTWAIMSVLMVRFGWAGVAVNCVLAGLVLTLARHRGMGQRAAASLSKR